MESGMQPYSHAAYTALRLISPFLDIPAGMDALFMEEDTMEDGEDYMNEEDRKIQYVFELKLSFLTYFMCI